MPGSQYDEQSLRVLRLKGQVPVPEHLVLLTFAFSRCMGLRWIAQALSV